MGTIIHGDVIAAELLDAIKVRVQKLRKPPLLIVVNTGDDPASRSYISRKQAACERVGIRCFVSQTNFGTPEELFLWGLKRLPTDFDPTAMILQLPLMSHFHADEALKRLWPELDVDCLTAANLTLLAAGKPFVTPPTAAAIIEILERQQVDLPRSTIVMVGHGQLVGQPLYLVFKNMGLDPIVCTEATTDLAAMTRQADVLVTGVGKRNLITSEMVKPGAVVVDAGFTMDGGRVYGDVDFHAVQPIARAITPTPGGVGPITVAKLLENVVTLAERRERGELVIK